MGKKEGKRKLQLATKIFIALVLAIIAGLALLPCPDVAAKYIMKPKRQELYLSLQAKLSEAKNKE